jgi:glycosyltransferase involved in cell wall biosynthesis
MTLRVLHVIPDGERRGAEVFAADLVRALGEAGVHQRVAAIHGPMDVDFDLSVDLLGTGSPRPLDLPAHLGVIRALRHMLAAWRPDVVQAHGGEALKYAVAASGAWPAPVVYRRIGAVSPWLDARWRKELHARLVRRAAVVVPVADALRTEVLSAFRLPPSRVVVIPNGVDPRRVEPAMSRMQARTSLGIPHDAVVVLSLGALTWEKDPLGHLTVTEPSLRAHPEAMHVLAGDGALRDALGAEVRRRGLEGRVRVLGNCADVASLLSASDVLLVASRTEGMPACAIEGAMAGLPTAAYALAGVGEVVEHGVTGVVAEAGDATALAAGLLAIVGDASARRAMGVAARQRCRKRFGIRTVAAQYLAVYEQLAGAGSGPGGSERLAPAVHAREGRR